MVEVEEEQHVSLQHVESRNNWSHKPINTRDGLISNPLTTKGVDRLAIGL